MRSAHATERPRGDVVAGAKATPGADRLERIVDDCLQLDPRPDPPLFRGVFVSRRSKSHDLGGPPTDRRGGIRTAGIDRLPEGGRARNSCMGRSPRTDALTGWGRRGDPGRDVARAVRRFGWRSVREPAGSRRFELISIAVSRRLDGAVTRTSLSLSERPEGPRP